MVAVGDIRLPSTLQHLYEIDDKRPWVACCTASQYLQHLSGFRKSTAPCRIGALEQHVPLPRRFRLMGTPPPRFCSQTSQLLPSGSKCVPQEGIEAKLSRCRSDKKGGGKMNVTLQWPPGSQATDDLCVYAVIRRVLHSQRDQQASRQAGRSICTPMDSEVMQSFVPNSPRHKAAPPRHGNTQHTIARCLVANYLHPGLFEKWGWVGPEREGGGGA